MSFYEQLDNFRQGSRNSVQNGNRLNEFDKYMHVPRPIEKVLYNAMVEINTIGGGLIMVVGNAGDGKSHMFSSMKSHVDHDFDPTIINSFDFYNDASESCSPQMDSMYTLQKALLQYASNYIGTTTKKMVMAINLGMLDEFIHNEDNQVTFPHILSAVNEVIPSLGNYISVNYNHDKIKIIDLSTHQFFEFVEPFQDNQPVVSSHFMAESLRKISLNDIYENLIYREYRGEVTTNSQYAYFKNYKLLFNTDIQKAIVSLVIEAIVRYRIVVSPRDYFGFINSILVYKDLQEKNSLDALLPNLIFNGGENKILKALQKLDPLKVGNKEVDKMIEEFLTYNEVPQNIADLINEHSIVDSLNDYYHNGGESLVKAVRFLIRYHYLTHYHTFDDDLRDYLMQLHQCFKSKEDYDLLEFYKLAEKCILPSKGVFFEKDDCVPLPFQTENFKFVSIVKKERNWEKTKQSITYIDNMPNVFFPFVRLFWDVDGKEEPVSLDMDFQLYKYLKSLLIGRSFCNYDSERNVYYSNFVETLVQYCQSDKDIRILSCDNTVGLKKDNTLLEMINYV